MGRAPKSKRIVQSSCFDRNVVAREMVLISVSIFGIIYGLTAWEPQKMTAWARPPSLGNMDQLN